MTLMRPHKRKARPYLNDSHVESGLLRELLSDVPRGLGRGRERRLEHLELLGLDGGARASLLAGAAASAAAARQVARRVVLARRGRGRVLAARLAGRVSVAAQAALVVLLVALVVVVARAQRLVVLVHAHVVRVRVRVGRRHLALQRAEVLGIRGTNSS